MAESDKDFFILELNFTYVFLFFLFKTETSIHNDPQRHQQHQQHLPVFMVLPQPRLFHDAWLSGADGQAGWQADRQAK